MNQPDQPVKFVVDNSVVMAWAFEDESDIYTENVLDSLTTSKAIVPAIWHLEVVNVLKTSERRGRLKEADSTSFVSFLESLPISTAMDACEGKMAELLSVARSYNLSSYDASYLLLAMKMTVPIATKDKALRVAALKAGVHIWQLESP